MTSIIVALPRIEDAKNIKNVLVRSGFSVAAACTTGAQVISQADCLSGGIVVCSYKLQDMIYSELNEYLSSEFEMLLMARPSLLDEVDVRNIMTLHMPLKMQEFLGTVEMMVSHMERARRKKKEQPKVRSKEDDALIKQAKGLLMDRNHMSEDEAHKYLQKCSMDSGTNLVETAQMVLAMER